jgi:hypothetical protein
MSDVDGMLEPEPDAEPASPAGPSGPKKTPMYQAFNAARYQRQALIREIQEATGRCLICYVSGIGAEIDRDDTLGFVDLLHNLTPGEDLDLLLHTGGGDIDAAEKLISMIHNRVGDAELRIVVPDFAKSAGTLMAIGADVILMSDTSELGPIDPQIVLRDDHGNRIVHSVQSYLDAYITHSEALAANPDDAVAKVMLAKLDPATVKLFEAWRDRARGFAEAQLKVGMFRNSIGNFTKIAAELTDTKKWLSHGQPIGWQDASQMGLIVEFLEPTSQPWQAYWQLYCHQRLAVKDTEKLFESDYASLTLEG